VTGATFQAQKRAILLANLPVAPQQGAGLRVND
jgi:hypothetical protein